MNRLLDRDNFKYPHSYQNQGPPPQELLVGGLRVACGLQIFIGVSTRGGLGRETHPQYHENQQTQTYKGRNDGEDDNTIHPQTPTCCPHCVSKQNDLHVRIEITCRGGTICINVHPKHETKRGSEAGLEDECEYDRKSVDCIVNIECCSESDYEGEVTDQQAVYE